MVLVMSFKAEYYYHKGIIFNKLYYTLNENDYLKEHQGCITVLLQGKPVRERGVKSRESNAIQGGWSSLSSDILHSWMQ